MEIDFIARQPHPETNETACTWLSRNAKPVNALWNEAATACAGTYLNGIFYIAAAFSGNTVQLFTSEKPESLNQTAAFPMGTDIKAISMAVHYGKVLLAILSDKLHVFDAIARKELFCVETEHPNAAVICIRGALCLLEGFRMEEISETGEKTGHIHRFSFKSTADYDYDTRKDVSELKERSFPAEYAGMLFENKGRVFLSCCDILDRCAMQNSDCFLCHESEEENTFSRRYLAIPSAVSACFFEGPDEEVYAVYIGSENSMVPGKAALIRMEWCEGDFFRPSRDIITENVVTCAFQPVPMCDQIRDSFVCNAPDGWYYLTGTTLRPGSTYWKWTNGIHIWRTKDFSSFEDFGVVYDYTENRTGWQMQASRAANTWAPEIVYYDNTFWLTYSTAPGCGLLKSISGSAKGPYQDMGRVVMKGIDSGFFLENNILYLIWQNGRIAPFNSGCTTFEQEPVHLMPVDGQQVGYEGAGLIHVGDWYVLYAAEWNGDKRIDGTYDMMYSVSRSMYGPYCPRRILIPHGGHGSLFFSKDGKLHFSMFGNDRTAAFRHGVGIGSIQITDTGDDLILTPEMISFSRE